MILITDPNNFCSVFNYNSIPVIVVSKGSLGVGGVHPGEEDSSIFDAGTTQHPWSGRVRWRGKNRLRGKDSPKIVPGGVVIKDNTTRE